MEAKKAITDSSKELFSKVESELAEGMEFKKCRQCGCMKEELEQTANFPQTPEHLKQKAANWLMKMEPIRYACLGCEYCYPAVAANMLSTALPHQVQGPTCTLEVRDEQWPPVAGEYFVIDPSASIAISTLGSPEIAKTIADAKIPGVCIVGKTETENIGIDKIIKNSIRNPTLRVLVLVGTDVKGHLPGATLLALHENGLDENQRVIGSPGRRPFLRNVEREDVNNFRNQLRVVNLIGVSELKEITSAIGKIVQQTSSQKTCCGSSQYNAGSDITEIVQAQEPQNIEMDKSGYFVILPDSKDRQILIEHYSYDDRLLRVIKGINAREIYWTIINNGWVTQLSHAAYLGKELTKAELSIQYNLPYVQDGA